MAEPATTHFEVDAKALRSNPSLLNLLIEYKADQQSERVFGEEPVGLGVA